MADEDSSIYEYISKVDELLKISEFVGSEQVDMALDMLVKVISKPDIPPIVAAKAIVQLQAVSSMCALQASYYKNINPGKAGSKEYTLKNVYFSLAQALADLCQAMKYLCK